MPRHAFASKEPQLFDSVKLSRKEFAALVAQIERGTTPRRHTVHNNRRIQVRYVYDPDAKLICQIARDEGSEVQIVVRCRNISVGGLGFMHGAYVHPGTRCVLTLITSTKRGYRLQGTVVRCRHLTRNIHEVGVQFETPIDLERMSSGLLAKGDGGFRKAV